MRLLYSVFFGLVLVFLSTSVNATPEPLSPDEVRYLNTLGRITLCVGPDTMPLETIEGGQHVGMNAEYMRFFQQQLPIPIELIETSSWDQSMEYVKSGKCQIISLASNTPERREFLDFTQPYVEIPFVVVTTQEKFFISRLATLVDPDIKLGVIKGYAYSELLKTRYPEMNIVDVESRLEGLQRVNSGELFGFFSGLHLAGFAIQEHGFTSLKINGQFDELARIELGIGVRKEYAPLVTIFDKLIAQLTPEQKNQINNSWRRVKFDIAESYTRTMTVTIGASIVLTLVLLWLWQIRKHSQQLKENERIIWQQAHYDYLTQLPNRRMFQDRLNQLLINHDRKSTRFALLLIDLDGFKEVNDTMGHDQGDALLKMVTERLSGVLRKSDSLSRLGGDEFTVIVKNLSKRQTAESVAQKMLEVMAQPFNIQGSPVYISASIGITLFPDDYSDQYDAATLMKNADQAMYEAKKLGKNQFHYYTDRMHHEALYRMEMLADLRSAIENEEFQLYYQPIVNLKSNRIEKLEALVRWHSDKRGVVPPNEFIPLLEETRLINTLGDYLFDQALIFSKLINADNEHPIEISLNVSPLQLKFKAVESWPERLQKDQSLVTLEVTESMLMEYNISDTLASLRNFGFKVSLDDFGVGYSSLAYLRQFPFDYLKIDRSFVNHMTDTSDELHMCKAIIEMAHQLKLSVIAEGVETEEQMNLLKNLNCDYAQGYLISRPLPTSEITALIKEKHRTLEVEVQNPT